MKKKLTYIIIIAAILLCSCSSDDISNDEPDQPVAPERDAVVFAGPQALAMTRSTTTLQDIGHYDFGMFAYKEQASGSGSVATMNNFLVGYDDGTGSHYKHSSATTWAKDSRKGYSPWFYEGLNSQPIVYWDKSYAQNSFYYYSPYRQNDSITFDRTAESFTISNGILSDDYDNAIDGYSQYAKGDAAKREFLYGQTTIAQSAYGNNIDLPFHHFDAQVQIGFYAATDNYYVEIADLDADNGRIKEGLPSYYSKGIQATPAGCTMNANGTVATVSADSASYISAYGKTTLNADGTSSPVCDDPVTTVNNIIFRIPDSISGNLTKLVHDNITHYCIPGSAANGTTQTYSYSPTTYYAMPQSQTYEANTTAGLTLHVTLRLIPKDSADHKETTIHNAAIYIPPYVMNGTSREPLTMWQSGHRYVYHFRITNNISGSTDPSEIIDPTSTNPTSGIELVDFDVYVPDPSTHSYRRTTISTITTGNEDPDLPADAKKNFF